MEDPVPSGAEDLPAPVNSEFWRAISSPPEAQAAAIDALCARHPDWAERVRQRAASLLTPDSGAGSDSRGRPRVLDGLVRAASGRPPIRGSGEPASGKYLVGDVIGKGGMGVVKAGRDEDLDRDVALKFLQPKRADDSDAVRRFVAEAQLGGQLQHPGIVPVYDIGVDGEQPFFAMKLVQGATFASKLAARESPHEEQQRHVAVFLQICQAIAYAHQKNVIHRDLKPGNVMVGEFGEVLVLDWGLAKKLGQEESSGDSSTRDAGDRALSRDGTAMGTCAYMSPEQAQGRHDLVDQRTDVFALGSILCEVLTLAPAYNSGAGDSEQRQEEEYAMAVGGCLDDAHARLAVCGADPALVQLAQACLAPNAQDRPADAGVVAARVSQHLAEVEERAQEARVVAETVRVRARAAISLAGVVILGLAAAVWLWRRADAARSEFDQLAGVVLYDRAVANEKDLYPPWPHRIEAMETWLRDDCGKLLGHRDEIERTVRELRKRALPPTEAEKQHDLDTHPRFAEWHHAEQKLASLRRAQAIRDGGPLVVSALSAEQYALDAQALNELAWDRVAPEDADRKVYGEEAFGLACARLAVTKATDAERCQLLDTLAWALLMNGQDAEARQRAGEALAAAPVEQTKYKVLQRNLEQAIATAAKTLAELESSCAALDAEVHTRQTWTFADEAPRFLHDTLSALLGKLASLETNEKASVEQRLRWAKAVAAVSIDAHRARWEQASAAINASEKYRSSLIDLRPQMGLVPLGPNPVTGLWEFYELRSAWDGVADPATIPIPAHRPDGSIEVTGETGIVFVLLPGGTFRMGSQKDDPNGANYDERHEDDEDLFEVVLAPFLLARHELTQGQWWRLTGEDPSYYKAGGDWGGVLVTKANPVEQVSWEDCERWLPRFGLVLPSEAQWEYGCRAGTATPWICPLEQLQHYANLADDSANRHVPSWSCEAWNDGYVVHAPVGAFRANGFGLFDVHGNVWEWIRDGNNPIRQPRVGDGLRCDPATSAHRVDRGGSFQHPALNARSANRAANSATSRGGNCGARVARLIRH